MHEYLSKRKNKKIWVKKTGCKSNFYRWNICDFHLPVEISIIFRRQAEKRAVRPKRRGRRGGGACKCWRHRCLGRVSGSARVLIRGWQATLIFSLDGALSPRLGEARALKWRPLVATIRRALRIVFNGVQNVSKAGGRLYLALPLEHGLW